MDGPEWADPSMIEHPPPEVLETNGFRDPRRVRGSSLMRRKSINEILHAVTAILIVRLTTQAMISMEADLSATTQATPIQLTKSIHIAKSVPTPTEPITYFQVY